MMAIKLVGKMGMCFNLLCESSSIYLRHKQRHASPIRKSPDPVGVSIAVSVDSSSSAANGYLRKCKVMGIVRYSNRMVEMNYPSASCKLRHLSGHHYVPRWYGYTQIYMHLVEGTF